VRGRRQDVASVPSFARLRATNKEEPPPPSTPPSRCTRAGPSRPPGWSTIDARPDTHTHTLTHTGDRPGVRVQLRTHACSAVVVLVNPSVNQPAHGRRSIDDAACLPACLPCPPARPRPSPTFHGRAALSPSPPLVLRRRHVVAVVVHSEQTNSPFRKAAKTNKVQHSQTDSTRIDR
jgi:hypothetical protein